MRAIESRRASALAFVSSSDAIESRDARWAAIARFKGRLAPEPTTDGSASEVCCAPSHLHQLLHQSTTCPAHMMLYLSEPISQFPMIWATVQNATNAEERWKLCGSLAVDWGRLSAVSLGPRPPCRFWNSGRISPRSYCQDMDAARLTLDVRGRSATVTEITSK